MCFDETNTTAHMIDIRWMMMMGVVVNCVALEIDGRR